MTDNCGWVNAASGFWVDDLIDSDPRILDDIRQWWDTTPPEPMVGSRHHTVPRSYLERFAAGGKIYVRDRVTGTGGLRSVKDTGAIKDFYTGINLNGQLDGRLERILSDIEGGADTVFRRLDPGEHLHVSIFLAFQLVRTPRHRREMELMGDYFIRVTHQSTPGITEVRAVPDPNLHLEYFTKNAPKLAEALFDRPTTVLTIDRPLFITGDEPVILKWQTMPATCNTCQLASRHRAQIGKASTRRTAPSWSTGIRFMPTQAVPASNRPLRWPSR